MMAELLNYSYLTSLLIVLEMLALAYKHKDRLADSRTARVTARRQSLFNGKRKLLTVKVIPAQDRSAVKLQLETNQE